MKEYHFSLDGITRYGDKYKHLASVTIELPEPELREGFTSEPMYNPETGEGYWNYQEIVFSQEELQAQKIESLEQSIAELTMAITMMMGGM